MAVNVNIFTYAMNPPGPPFSASDDDKLNWPEVSVSSVDLNDYPWHHEVLGAIVNMTGEWHQTAHTNTNFRAFNDATNELLFEMDILLPPNKPDETYIGVEQKFWIGRADWEIKGPMKVRMEVSTTGGQVPSVSKTLFMDVIDTGLPPDEVLEDGNIIIHAKKVGMNPDLIVVDFITDPPGADISIQGHGRGTSPFYTFFLGSLPRRVIITKEGFERFEFVIPSRFIGYEIDVNATLRPIVPVETGNLKVKVMDIKGASIRDATVSLHPESVANLPIRSEFVNSEGIAEFDNVDAGHYEISTVADDFETKVTPFDIVKGELTSLIVVLEPVAPQPGEEPPWWRKILDYLLEFPIFPSPIDRLFLESVYKELTGQDIPDDLFERFEFTVRDFLFSLDTASILLTGKNLLGQPDEVTDLDVALAAIDVLLLFVPVGGLAKYSKRVALEFGDEAVFDVTAKVAKRLDFGDLTTWLRQVGYSETAIRKIKPSQLEAMLRGLPDAKVTKIIDEMIARAEAPTQARLIIKSDEAVEALGMDRAIREELFVGFLRELKFNAPVYKKQLQQLSKAELDKLLAAFRKDASGRKIRAILQEILDDKIMKSVGLAQRTKDALLGDPVGFFKGFLKYAMYIWTVDTIVAWGAVDNLGFLTVRPAEEIERLFNDGKITKEEALARLDRKLKILDLGLEKLETSKYTNPFALLFYGVFKAIAEENIFEITQRRDRIEGTVGPTEKGRIVVNANVDEARVWRNGEFVGLTPYEAEWVEGIYTVLVSKDGYEPHQEGVEIIKDQELTIFATLTLIDQVGQIIVTSNPEKDATIYLDDQPQTRKTDTTLFNVPLGLHKVRIFKEPFGNVEYIAEPDEISVNLLGIDQVERADFVLTAREIPPETGGIAVTSLPSGATIWLNDIQQQFPTNTVIKELTPGTYRVKIHKDGYEDPLERTIEVKAGAIESADFGALTILPAAKGTLVIDVFPGDVEIWERGEKKYQIDPSGHIEISLDPAGYDFILKKEGFKDHSLNVFIGEGETVFRSVTMTELPPDFGTVKILTSVPFVDVKRAYIYLGTTDVTGALEIALPPGNHQLVFTKDGYQTKIKTAIVRAGEGTDLTVEMELEEEPPVFFNAWAYTISTTPPGAKIIIDEFFTGKWTTDTIFLEPEAVYQLRLEKSGFLPFETTIVTEPLPGGGGATEQSQTQSSNNPNSSNNPGFKENPFGFDKELNQDMRLFT